MLNMAVVGTGNWGRNLVRNFYEMEEANLKICCDLNEALLSKIREKYPLVKITTDYDEVLRNEEIEAVVIATSTSTHFDLAKKALEAKKHIFVEKPFTVSYKQAQELVNLAKEKKKKLMVGHLLEYHPAVIEMKRRLSQNEIGDVYYLYSERLNLGKVRTMENALWSLAPHDISVMLYLLNSEPVEVSAYGGVFLQRKEKIEDVVFVNTRLENGVVANFHLSWLDPNKVRRITLVGSEKMMVFDDMESRDKLKIFDKELIRNNLKDGVEFNIRYGDIYVPKIEVSEPLKLECLHFIDCIKNNKTPRSDGEDGLRVVRILGAAQESLDKGGMPVRMKENE
ncbi:Gfo/Idh/MocA family oxidoreductase [Candidatus Aerophobetes bacterium]|uniref:Gfo/Idh/MocA family oxidoreductase n=1 Tax=Aerophobetes bacterium TaxID=2030807 RepID=A0A523S527_UNCAE|nr:MAG: Gfo/Idh/MocA family oxidoreductase [Candidatus Aerophobetes bacterium]